MPFAPYDYIEDADGWTYVLAGSCSDGASLVATAVFSPAPVRFKCKASTNVSQSKPRASRAHIGGPLDFTIPLGCVARHYDRTQQPLGAIQGGAPPPVCTIERISVEHGCKAYLFGSRRLGFERPESDWDLLILGDTNPRILMDEIQRQLADQLRPYSPAEITRRVERYAALGLLPRATLERLFALTTRYFRWGDRDVALFFARGNPMLIPTAAEIESMESGAIAGTIVENAGLSYLMPRSFRIRNGGGKMFDIQTIWWELGGLEECAGTTVFMDGVRRLHDGSMWLGGSESSFAFKEKTE